MGVLALSRLSAAADPPLHILKVTSPDKAAYVRLFTMGLDLPEALPGAEVTVIGSDAEREWLEAQGYSVRYEVRDASRFYASRAQAAGAATMGGFRTLTESWAAIDSLVNLYPGVVSAKLTIGTTVQTRPIYALRISDNPNTDEGEPAILFTGMHHAREPISPHIVLHTMRQLAENYGTDSLITRLVNEREIWFIPFVNPDGYAHNELTNPGGGGMWRKNRKSNGGGTFGVDPNRNYGDHWGHDNSGSSPDPGDDTYRGTGPFSEKETQAVRDFVTPRTNIRIALNYHSYSNLFLWAPGYDQFYVPDHEVLAALADSAVSWNNYAPMPGWGLYLTNGDSDDWMYFDRNILSFTPEVGNGSDGFWPDPDRIEPLTNENYPVNLFMIDLADTPERILMPDKAVWDSVALVGEDSLGLYWTSDDTTSVNQAETFRVRELQGPQEGMDGLEDGADRWVLDGFQRTASVQYLGAWSLFSESGDNYTANATLGEPFLVEDGDTMSCFMHYNVELDYDYIYLEASTDGILWTSIPGSLTTSYNPHGQNDGNGITGSSLGVWVPAFWDLSDYSGSEVQLRFSYRTDGGIFGYGVYLDNVTPVLSFDTSMVVATTGDRSVILPDYPDGEYYFRVESEDAQGQVSTSLTKYFSYFTGPQYMLGDVNESGAITSADIVVLVNYVFKGGPAPIPVWEAGDVNLTGAITSADIIFLVNYVFKGGPAPGT